MKGAHDHCNQMENKELLKKRKEKRISRREILKGGVGGLGILLFGSSLPSCVTLRKKSLLAEFWKRADQIGAGDLLDSVLSASRAQVEYSRALAASERIAALLGEDAGKAERSKAQEYFNKRTRELQNAKTALNRLANRMTKEEKMRFDKYLNARGMNIITAEGRRVAINRLVAADLMPNEAKEAVQKLDKNLAPVSRLQSFDDLATCLDRQLDSHMSKKFGNPGAGRGLCILLLLLSSIYLVLVIVAILVWVLVCIFTLGFACESVTAEDILNDMIDNACGPE